MNVTLPSWDELEPVRFTPVQLPHATRSHSLASLHMSSPSSPQDARRRDDDDASLSSEEQLQLVRPEPTKPRHSTTSSHSQSGVDTRLKKYQEAVVEMASAMDLMCGHIEHALAADTSGGNLDEICAVLQARFSTVRASASLPIQSLRSSFDRMCALVSALVAQLYEGASRQRKLYQQEIARIQEVANMATRKAVSVQREQAASQMEHLRASLETETSRQLEELKAKYQQCQQANRFYESEINRLTSELKQQEKFRQELLQQQDVQAQRMVALHNENWKQKQAELEHRYASHLDSIKAKLQSKLLDVKQKYEQQLTLERNQFAKREYELSAERADLRQQVAQLSERVAHSASEIEAIAKRHNEAFLAEKERLVAYHEEKLKEAQLNHFQLLAAVKEQAANQVTAVQNEALREQQRREAVHKAELKRVTEQAKLAQESLAQEVRLEAENKAHREKILKDSEIRRLTQANQRLQRLLDQREARQHHISLEAPLNPPAPAESEAGVMKELELSTEGSEDDSVGEIVPSLDVRSGTELRLEPPQENPFKDLQRVPEEHEQAQERPREVHWGVLRIALAEQADPQIEHKNSNEDEFQHISHLDSYLANEGD